MLELLSSIKEFAEELEKKSKKILKLKNGKSNDYDTFNCIYDHGGAELIYHLEKFFLAFYATVESKGLTFYKGPMTFVFLKRSKKIRREIFKRCSEERKQKEEEDRIKNGRKKEKFE